MKDPPTCYSSLWAFEKKKVKSFSIMLIKLAQEFVFFGGGGSSLKLWKFKKINQILKI